MLDVYEGAPFPVMVYLAIIPKISLIFIFFRLYYFVFPSIFEFYQVAFVIFSIASIMVGSIAAIYQTKVKRLLVYSMVTNTGYLALGLSFGGASGVFATLFYLISYVFVMFGLFFCFAVLRDRCTNLLIKQLSSLINLVEINPALALSIFTLLFSIAGIPPLLGFYGKFFLFLSAVKFGMYWVSILFVIFSSISVFYYIRLAKMIYFNRSRG
jgi:NADH-quinone oxidoreductase subunit N